ncbi:MAG: acetylxylan esterase [Lachnospiraceae bacterium]|nr:acetylxylan esterase [Lachnospiraceae bacterium]MBO4630730.1 acetylxylan esterase [Lentisphaeria bacterium]
MNIFPADPVPYPREGSLSLLYPEDDPAFLFLRSEGLKWERLSHLDIPETSEELKLFQRKLRKAIRQKMLLQYDSDLPLDLKITRETQYKGYKVYSLAYQSTPQVYVTALLYRPEGEGSFPAVLQFHGHNHDAKFAERVQATAQGLVKNGFICLSVDAWGCYERSEICRSERDSHMGFAGSALFPAGETLMGRQVTDNMRGVDLLLSLPYVDRKRIGAVGASGGGNQTMWLAAMDERIACSFMAVSVGSFRSYVTGLNCVCEVLPDGLTLTTEAGVLSLIAPRPLRISNALFDTNPTFAVPEMLKTYHEVEEVYWKMRHPENITYTTANEIHGMWEQSRQAALGWFLYHLQGKGNGNPVPEPKYIVEDEQNLYVFPNPEKRFPEMLPPYEWIVRKCEKQKKKLFVQNKLNASRKRVELKRLLRLPPPGKFSIRRFPDREGLEQYAVVTPERILPVLVKRNGSSRDFRLILTPFGKEDSLGLAEKKTFHENLVFADLFGSGENGRQHPYGGQHLQLFRQLMWIGRRLAGEWTREILYLTDFIRSCLKGENMTVTGYREAGICALFAAVLAAKGFPVEAEESPITFICKEEVVRNQDGTPFYSPLLFLPDALRWGDISLAVALAQGEVHFSSPRRCSGKEASKEDICEWEAEIVRLKNEVSTTL